MGGKKEKAGGAVGLGVRLTWHTFLKLKKQNICSVGKKRIQIKDCSHEVKINEWIEVKRNNIKAVAYQPLLTSSPHLTFSTEPCAVDADTSVNPDPVPPIESSSHLPHLLKMAQLKPGRFQCKYDIKTMPFFKRVSPLSQFI